MTSSLPDNISFEKEHNLVIQDGCLKCTQALTSKVAGAKKGVNKEARESRRSRQINTVGLFYTLR